MSLLCSCSRCCFFAPLHHRAVLLRVPRITHRGAMGGVQGEGGSSRGLWRRTQTTFITRSKEVGDTSSRNTTKARVRVPLCFPCGDEGLQLPIHFLASARVWVAVVSLIPAPALCALVQHVRASMCAPSVLQVLAARAAAMSIPANVTVFISHAPLCVRGSACLQ